MLKYLSTRWAGSPTLIILCFKDTGILKKIKAYVVVIPFVEWSFLRQIL